MRETGKQMTRFRQGWLAVTAEIRPSIQALTDTMRY